MAINIGPTYTDITIEPNTISLDLDEVTGSIRPGALANMCPYGNIKWGKHQTDKIEPGVIPYLDFVSLMLDETYKYPADDIGCDDLYIHDSNREFAPTKGDFWFE